MGYIIYIQIVVLAARAIQRPEFKFRGVCLAVDPRLLTYASFAAPNLRLICMKTVYAALSSESLQTFKTDLGSD